MRNIVFHKETKTFHLYNDQIRKIDRKKIEGING